MADCENRIAASVPRSLSLRNIGDDAVNELTVRLVALEDLFMTNMPRIASMEFRMGDVSRMLSGYEKRLDREMQRRLLQSEAAEVPEPEPSAPPLPAPAAPSHRGAGAFSTVLAQRTTPPGSVTLTGALAEDAPMWREPESFQIGSPGGCSCRRTTAHQISGCQLQVCKRNVELIAVQHGNIKRTSPSRFPPRLLPRENMKHTV